MTALEILPAVLSVLALCLTAAMVVAGRSLNRLQRRAWATGGGQDAPDNEAILDVETAFISLSLARQLLLVAVVVQLGYQVRLRELEPWFGITVAAGIVAYVIFDKLLPYWLVAVAGSSFVLRIGRPLFAVARVLLGPLARHLSSVVGRARARNLEQLGDTEGSDLGAFLDLAEEEGMVSESEEALLRGVADFEDAVARQVMTPRVDIVAIDAGASLAELRGVIAERRLSRIPVIADDLDHVVGIANLKDLVAALDNDGEQEAVTSIVRSVWFVPETKRVNELLEEFQHRREQMTIVVDEYGGTAGLVTLEDVLEEIVGEIRDEDEDAERLVELRPDGVIASGKAEIEDVEEAIGRDVEPGEFHTVGGMVFTHLGRVPNNGERFDVAGLELEVLEADERRVHRVHIRLR